MKLLRTSTIVSAADGANAVMPVVAICTTGSGTDGGISKLLP